MTKVLSVTSECVPLVKTGGLADVAGALPGALAGFGVDMRTLLPGYPAVMNAQPDAVPVRSLGDLFGGEAWVRRGTLGDQVLYILDAPHLFNREGGLYLGPDGRDWPDNPVRFAALSHTAARIASEGVEGWTPEAVHLHDWQAGLTPVYMRQMGAGNTPSLLTIHNIAFQGGASANLLGPLGLPAHDFHSRGFEYYGYISALKAGIVFSHRVSTVSPTYATELMTEEFGMGLEGVLRERAGDFIGILNGIDEAVWSPPYKTAKGKAKHRDALRAEFGLPPSDGPLCIAISRLTGQKGLDLLIEALPSLLAHGGQLALLGSGDARLEAQFRDAAARHANVAVRIGYDEPLSKRMMAGGDAILIPSRFEPCGLTQLYGLRYGTLPLVAATGGLADTVIDANPAALAQGVATGVQFHPVTARALGSALSRLCALWRDKPAWERAMTNAMAQPVGWDASARVYADLFADMMQRSQA